MTTIRWRLNDPAEEHERTGRQVRWTKVHRVSLHASDITACHIIIPDMPYDQETDGQIPDAAPMCKRCALADHRER